MAYAVPKYSFGFEIAGNLVVAVAAPVYIVLSTAMIFYGQFYALKNAMLVSMLSYIPYFFVYISVQNDIRMLLLFFYYLFAVLYAYIGSWFIFCRHGLKRKNCEYQAFAFLFAASFGIFNFLLPAFAFLQNNDANSNNNIDAMSFLGRVLDATFYLPIATASFIWLDKKEMYHINVEAEGTKYKESESSEKLNDNDSSILLGVTDSSTDDDDIGTSINNNNERNKRFKKQHTSKVKVDIKR